MTTYAEISALITGGADPVTLEQRFATEFISPATDEPGLVLGDDGVVYIVKPDGSRIPAGGGGGSLPDPWTADNVTGEVTAAAEATKVPLTIDGNIVIGYGPERIALNRTGQVDINADSANLTGSHILRVQEDSGLAPLQRQDGRRDSRYWTGGTRVERAANREPVTADL